MKLMRDARILISFPLWKHAAVAYREGTVSWIPWHLDTSSGQLETGI